MIEMKPPGGMILSKSLNKLDEAHGEAIQILTENGEALHEIARVLQEEEVIDGGTVARIAQGSTVEGSQS